MEGITYDYMVDYLRGLIRDNLPVLEELEDYASKNNIPIVQKETARFLELITAIQQPNRILELGTAIGYSSILMSESLNNKVDILTIERDSRMIALAKDNIMKHGYNNIKILEGEALDILEGLEGTFDMIFLDGGQGHYNHYLPHCLRLLSKDGVIVADNVLFRGMVASDELIKRRKITIVKRMRKYLDEVNANPALITSVIPMGDGIAITRRRIKT
ncbi:MAG: O-methyltransferase [Clostridiaceae bacterium]